MHCSSCDSSMTEFVRVLFQVRQGRLKGVALLVVPVFFFILGEITFVRFLMRVLLDSSMSNTPRLCLLCVEKHDNH